MTFLTGHRLPPWGCSVACSAEHGDGVQCGDPYFLGHWGKARKADIPLPVTHLHFRGEPGAKPFVEDPLLRWGFLEQLPCCDLLKVSPERKGLKRK